MTVIDVCNKALSRIGDERITALTDGTVAATACADHIDITIDEVLRVFPWNCAVSRATLTGPSAQAAWSAKAYAAHEVCVYDGYLYMCCVPGNSTTAPVANASGYATSGTATFRRVASTAMANLSGFTYVYVIPADCVRVLDINGAKSYMYRIEGPLLYTNEDIANLRYIRRIVPGEMDSVLLEALVARLASKIAYRITSSQQVVQQNYQEYAVAVNLAQSIAAAEDREDLVDVLKLYQSAQIAQKQNSATESGEGHE